MMLTNGLVVSDALCIPFIYVHQGRLPCQTLHIVDLLTWIDGYYCFSLMLSSPTPAGEVTRPALCWITVTGWPASWCLAFHLLLTVMLLCIHLIGLCVCARACKWQHGCICFCLRPVVCLVCISLLCFGLFGQPPRWIQPSIHHWCLCALVGKMVWWRQTGLRALSRVKISLE